MNLASKALPDKQKSKVHKVDFGKGQEFQIKMC